MCIHLYNYIQLAVLRRVYVRMHFVTPNEWYFVEDQVDQGGYNYINYYYLLLLFLLLYGSWKTSRFTPMNQNSRRTTPNSMVCPGQRHPSGPHRIPGVSKKPGPRMRKTLLPHFSWASFTATKMAFQDIPSSQYFATCRRLKLTRGGDDSEAPLFFMIHHEVITNAERSHHADVVVSA